MDSTKILLSTGTPNGAKLEELLDDVVKDLEFKNSKLDPSDSIDRLVMNNNSVVIQSLKSCIDIQTATMGIIEEGYSTD